MRRTRVAAFTAKALAALLIAGSTTLAASSLRPEAATAAPSGPMVSVIVTLKDQAAIAGDPRANRRARLTGVVNALRQKADATQPGLRSLLETARRRGLVAEYRPFWVFNGVAVTATPEFVSRLARRREVLRITPDASFQAPLVDAPTSEPEPNLSLVGAPELWGLGYTGAGIVIASMDTGVQASHPDLATQWRGGTNSWFDPYGQHPTPADMSGHGTRTMGVMVGRTAGGSAVGMAPDAQWIAAKIFNDAGTATTSRVHEAFQWLLDPDGNPATPDAPHVVNNSWSLSGAGCNPEYQLDLQALRAANILPVFSAGNYGPNEATSRSPANNPEAFAVGATTNTDVIWASSARGPSACADADPTYPELVAPGVSIRTTDRFAGYVTASGTSFSAPHVTGAVALLLAAHADATPAQLETALEGTGLDLGTTGPDTAYGYGRLDVLAAHAWLASAPPDFALVASPTSASAIQGATVTFAAAVTPSNGFVDDVTLSIGGLPAGVSATFDPAVVAGANGSSLLSVSISPATPVGEYPLTITGTGGSLTRAALVRLRVDPPPDFSLTVAPPSSSTPQGGTASFTTTITPVNGFTGDVGLAVAGLPAAASASFAPAVVVGGEGSSELAVTVAANTAVGTYPLTITATGGSLVHQVMLTLGVTPSQQTVFPSTTSIVTGTYRSGSASNLSADDTALYEVNSTNGGQRTAAWYGSMLAVPNGLTNLRVTYKGMNSRSCTQTVAIRNWTAGTWLVLDTRTVGTTEVIIADLSPGGALADYVSGSSGNGDLRLRIRCQTRSGSFYSSGNLMRITFTPP